MLPEYPALRSDLVTREVRQGGGTSYLIKDPVTNRFFRLKESEQFIALQLDGRISLEEVKRRFEARFDVPLPAEKLEAFVDRLWRLCLIERGLGAGELARVQRAASAGAGAPGGFLYLRLKAIDPDAFFDLIAPHLRFLFSRRFVLVVVAMTIIAVAIIWANQGTYAGQFMRLLHLSTIVTVIVSVFVVTFLHEAAHGLTCKHYGGHVHEMGFLLIYLLPAFYCNVSDAWLFPEKRKRIWVSFAGMFFQIFVWAAAVIIWRVVDPETWVSDVCAVVMVTSGISTLFSLNPLIKLDGYYMLADYLDIPNLRAKAFEYLGSGVRRLWASPGTAPRPVTRREREVYITYGVIAGLYSVVLLSFIFLRMAGAVVSRYHGAGLIVLVAATTLAFTGSFEKGILKIRHARAEGKGLPMKRRRLWGTIAVTAAVLVILAFAKWELKILGTFRLFPDARSSVRAEVAGILAGVFVDEGDTVQAGGAIARIDDREYRAELRETEADAAKWQAELELLRTGPLREEIARLESLVERAKMKVAYSEREYERVSELYRKSLVSPYEHEKAQQELTLDRKDLERVESDLKVLKIGNRPEKIREAEAEIERLGASREFLAEEIAKAMIRSPISGVVASHRLRDKLGEHLDVGDEVCQIVNCDKMLLEMPVSERDVMDIREGQKVKLKARSMPEKSFYGRVVSVPPIAIDSQSRTVLIVTSEVDNAQHFLKPGMTGAAKIYCGKRTILDLWTRKLIRFVRVEFWWW